MDEIRGACRDATAVIHTAAVVDVSSLQDREKMQMVNIKGEELWRNITLPREGIHT